MTERSTNAATPDARAFGGREAARVQINLQAVDAVAEILAEYDLADLLQGRCL